MRTREAQAHKGRCGGPHLRRCSRTRDFAAYLADRWGGRPAPPRGGPSPCTTPGSGPRPLRVMDPRAAMELLKGRAIMLEPLDGATVLRGRPQGRPRLFNPASYRGRFALLCPSAPAAPGAAGRGAPRSRRRRGVGGAAAGGHPCEPTSDRPQAGHPSTALRRSSRRPASGAGAPRGDAGCKTRLCQYSHIANKAYERPLRDCPAERVARQAAAVAAGPRRFSPPRLRGPACGR
jgi:hypothetical protein